jgi:hypothetical protein
MSVSPPSQTDGSGKPNDSPALDAGVKRTQ